MNANPVKTMVGVDEKSAIFIKNMIKEIGKAFIVIFLSKNCNGKLTVQINHEKLKESELFLANSRAEKL